MEDAITRIYRKRNTGVRSRMMTVWDDLDERRASHQSVITRVNADHAASIAACRKAIVQASRVPSSARLIASLHDVAKHVVHAMQGSPMDGSFLEALTTRLFQDPIPRSHAPAVRQMADAAVSSTRRIAKAIVACRGTGPDIGSLMTQMMDVVVRARLAMSLIPAFARTDARTVDAWRCLSVVWHGWIHDFRGLEHTDDYRLASIGGYRGRPSATMREVITSIRDAVLCIRDHYQVWPWIGSWQDVRSDQDGEAYVCSDAERTALTSAITQMMAITTTRSVRRWDHPPVGEWLLSTYLRATNDVPSITWDWLACSDTRTTMSGHADGRPQSVAEAVPLILEIQQRSGTPWHRMADLLTYDDMPIRAYASAIRHAIWIADGPQRDALIPDLLMILGDVALSETVLEAKAIIQTRRLKAAKRLQASLASMIGTSHVA
jgi:hypothetical protein